MPRVQVRVRSNDIVLTAPTMEEEEFRALPPKQQIVSVTQTLGEGDYRLLELFILQHDPQKQVDMSTELESALSNKEFFLDILGEAENRPDCFVALMRLWSRIGT